MRKLIAVLVLSIAMTGLSATSVQALEPPMVSIGEQPVEAVVASLTSIVLNMDCHNLVIPMEQSDVLDNVPALTPLAYVATSAAVAASGCDLQRGTTLPTLFNPLTEPQHGREIRTLYEDADGTSIKMYAPEVAGLSSRRLVLLLK